MAKIRRIIRKTKPPTESPVDEQMWPIILALFVLGGFMAGTVLAYEFFVSADGAKWGKPVARGEFANIRNNPGRQVVRFGSSRRGRFVRLRALSEVNGGPHASAAEIGVLTR